MDALVNMSGWESTREEGKPELPRKTFSVAVPAGDTWTYRILTLRQRQYRGYRPLPVSTYETPELDENGLPSSEPRAVRLRDEAVYSRHSFYPAEPVQVHRGLTFRGIPYAVVEVTPVLADPASGLLRYYDKIVVEFIFDRGAAAKSAADLHVKDVADPLFADAPKHFLNPEDARLFRGKPGSAALRDLERRMKEDGTFAPQPMSADLPLYEDPDAYKIHVSQTGIHRLTYAYLSANTTLPLGSLDPRNFRLYLNGQEVPLFVSGEGDGVFNSGDYIEFYGLSNDGVDGGFNRGDYSDTNVYWLRVSSSPGLRMTSRSVAPVNGYATAPYFNETIRYELNYDSAAAAAGKSTGFVVGQPAFAGMDRWMWFRVVTASGAKTPDSYTTTLSVPSPASGSWTGALEVELFSPVAVSANPDSRARVSLSGTQVIDHSWDGKAFATVQASVDSNNIKASSSLKVEAPAMAGVANNVVWLNWAKLTYRRGFQALNNELAFSYGAGNNRFAVTGFGSSGIVLYDITNPAAPVRLTGGTVSGSSSFTLTFEDSLPSGSRTYASTSAPKTPDSTVQNTSSNLRAATNGADWILIADDTFYNHSALTDLLNHRQGQGLRVKKVRLQDIYDEFKDGQTHPGAIRDFLAWAYANWVPPAPAYAVLVGEASLDYKNVMGKSPYYNHVPALMKDSNSSDNALGYYACEPCYGTFSEEAFAYPEIIVGRLSVQNGAELQGFVDRLINYDTISPAGAWRGHAVLVSDENETIFEQAHDVAAGSIPSPYSFQKIYYGKAPYGGCHPNCGASCGGGTTANVRDDIISALDAGAGILSYNGHGAWQLWSDEFMTVSGSPACTPGDTWGLLANTGKMHFQINANCYTGGFYNQILQQCFGERATRLGADRGSIAFYASNSLSFAQIGYGTTTRIFRDMFERNKNRNVGSIVLNHQIAEITTGIREEIDTYTLLGDPAVNLIIPAPGPSENLWVDSVANKTVNLAWDASADPVAAGYHVYRCDSNCDWPNATFNRITAVPNPGLTYADTTVNNLQSYTYYITTTDADGFEGAASNMVSAVPINFDPPNPPVLTGLSDMGLGRRLLAEWQPNGEDDLSYYTIHYGPASKTYTNSVTAYKTETSWVLETLGYDGSPWFVAMTATNTSGKTSGYSAEWSAVPTAASHAFRPPQFELRMGRPHNGNPVLKWTVPALDIYGSPVTVDRFFVYRSLAGPDFSPQRQPGSPDRIGIVLLGDCEAGECEFEDTASGSGPAWYYVTAMTPSPDNEESSVGRAHPVAVYNVWSQPYYYGYYGPDDVEIWWQAPNPLVDFSGKPTTLVKYRVYASTDPSFQPDRYAGSNRVLETALPYTRCCPSGCEIERPDCDLLYFRITIVDSKNNEGMH